jgi:hypothetical protein
MHLCTFDKTTNTTAASCVLATDMSPSQLIPRKQRNVFNVFISQIIILALNHTRPSRSLLTHTALSITQTNHEHISWMHAGLHVKCLLFQSNFNQKRNMSTNFNKHPKHPLFHVDRQTDNMTRLKTDFHNNCISRHNFQGPPYTSKQNIRFSQRCW